MSPAVDVVVVGAGPNGLATAGLLARAGRRVLVLERRGVVGGLAVAGEFHSGFHGPGPLHDSRAVRRQVVEALQLERHGLRLRASPAELLVLDAERGALRLGANPQSTAQQIARRSAEDAEGYLRYHRFLGRIRHVLASLLDQPPLDLLHLETESKPTLIAAALRLRRLGRADLAELLRLPSLSLADWLAEWFEDEQLRSAVALPALAGTRVGPRAPGTTTNLLLLEAGNGPGALGGGRALVHALQRAASAHGAEIRTDAAVARIVVGPSGVEGVELVSGETIATPVVAASCDPRHLFCELLPPGTLAHPFERHIREWRAQGTTGQVLLALSRAPVFAAAPESSVEFACVCGRIDDLERAADVVKYAEFPEHPALEIHVSGDPPSVVASVLVHFVPYDLRPAWDPAGRERLGDRVVAILERHAPGLSDSILGRRILTPRDIEAHYGTSGGHIHHGEHALDQLLIRPAPGSLGSRTPISGLYLCGSGTHPGGGLTCAPAARAAATILVGNVRR